MEIERCTKGAPLFLLQKKNIESYLSPCFVVGMAV